MKTKSMVLLAMALGCGLVAMLGVQQILSGEKTVKDTVPVLVAKQEIGAGVKLEPPNVAFEEWPRENVPPGAVTEPAQYEDRAVKVRSYPGDVILQAKLGDKGEFGAACQIPKGMRVATVAVNMTTVNSGMIRPGDRVDVLCTYTMKRPGSPETSRTKAVLEYIEVFAIDRNREGEGNDSNKGTKAENLSVLVTPEQARLLTHAANKGKLQMSLRNSEDRVDSQLATVDDNIFDELQPSTGAEKEEQKPKAAEPSKPIPEASFKQFLQADNQAPTLAEPTEEVWAIEIYEGDKKRVETIKRPLPKRDEAEPKILQPAGHESDAPAVEAGLT
jgi:pilus assembly protein CpaB